MNEILFSCVNWESVLSSLLLGYVIGALIAIIYTRYLK